MRDLAFRFLRAFIVRVVPGNLQKVDFTAAGEEHHAKELWQHYGLASRPQKGMEGLAFRLPGWTVITNTEDRESRPALEDGEVALYTDEGDTIILKRGRIIEVNAGTKVKITAPEVEVVASAKVTFTTPLVECSTDLKVKGNLTVDGTSTQTGLVTAPAGVAAPGGVTAAAGAPSPGTMADSAGTMAAIRAKYNTHTHPENGTGGGTTSAPNQTF